MSLEKADVLQKFTVKHSSGSALSSSMALHSSSTLQNYSSGTPSFGPLSALQTISIDRNSAPSTGVKLVGRDLIRHLHQRQKGGSDAVSHLAQSKSSEPPKFVLQQLLLAQSRGGSASGVPSEKKRELEQRHTPTSAHPPSRPSASPSSIPLHHHHHQHVPSPASLQHSGEDRRAVTLPLPHHPSPPSTSTQRARPVPAESIGPVGSETAAGKATTLEMLMKGNTSSFPTAPLQQPSSLLMKIRTASPGEFKKCGGVNDYLLHAFEEDRRSAHPTTIDNFNATQPIIRTLPPLSHPEGRLIIVGDVHGCAQELQELVTKVRFDPERDQLLMVGDLVNKGPDSEGVVRLCQKWKALAVLGNHDMTLLDLCDKNRTEPFKAPKDPVKSLAIRFPEDCEQYLRRLPHIIRIPQFQLIVVHAGIDPRKLLEEQSVYNLLHMRYIVDPAPPPKNTRDQIIVADGVVIKGAPPDARLWGAMYHGPETIIFGHAAQTGYQDHPYALGIDVGCVYGKRLMCLIYSEEERGRRESVAGLKRDANELKGLPPPESDVYEQHLLLPAEAVERSIVRPSTRPGSPSSANFLLHPANNGSVHFDPDGLRGPQKLSSSRSTPRSASVGTLASSSSSLHLGAAVSNPLLSMTPSSLHDRFREPAHSVMVPPRPTTSPSLGSYVGSNVARKLAVGQPQKNLVRLTLEQLVQHRHFGAVAQLLALKDYDQALEALAEEALTDVSLAKSFFLSVALALLDVRWSTARGSSSVVRLPAAEAEALLQMGVEWCEALPVLRESVEVQRKLQALMHEEDIPKVVQHYAKMVLRVPRSDRE